MRSRIERPVRDIPKVGTQRRHRATQLSIRRCENLTIEEFQVADITGCNSILERYDRQCRIGMECWKDAISKIMAAQQRDCLWMVGRFR